MTRDLPPTTVMVLWARSRPHRLKLTVTAQLFPSPGQVAISLIRPVLDARTVAGLIRTIGAAWSSLTPGTPPDGAGGVGVPPPCAVGAVTVKLCETAVPALPLLSTARTATV